MTSIISFTLYFCVMLAVCVSKFTPSFDNLLSGKICWQRACDDDSKRRAIRSSGNETGGVTSSPKGTGATNWNVTDTSNVTFTSNNIKSNVTCTSKGTVTSNVTCTSNGTDTYNGTATMMATINAGGISVYSPAKTLVLLLGTFIIL